MVPGTLTDGVEAASLDDVMRESDVVVVLATLNEKTKGLIGSRELAFMKPSAFLVNTARGELIDENALIETLTHQKIAGAALDTFTVEPLPAESPLRALSNVILTPHMVGQTQAAADEFKPVLLESALRILDGNLPIHCKNADTHQCLSTSCCRII